MDVRIWSSIIDANQQHLAINKTLIGEFPFDLVAEVIAQPYRKAKSNIISPKKKSYSQVINLVHMVDNHDSEEITHQCWVVLIG
jgi:hypothetical protein